MSILNKQLDNTPSVEKVANNLINKVQVDYHYVVNSYEESLKRFWKNPLGYTPQEVATALGEDGGELFQMHGHLYNFIKNVNPSAELTEVATLGTFTIDGDGNITVTSVL